MAWPGSRTPAATAGRRSPLPAGTSLREAVAEIVRIRENREIGAPAKLRRALPHASLPTHQSSAHRATLEIRKDFANRARGQENLLGREIGPAASRSPAA